MQTDVPRLYEVGDLVTWPVELIDGRTADWWPEPGLLLETTITIEPGLRPSTRFARSGPVRAAWRGEEQPGETVQVHAALDVDIWMPPPTHVTGIIREILIAEPMAPGARLTPVDVAPLSCDLDAGLIVMLEPWAPRCRCGELRSLRDPDATQYARRHLLEIWCDPANAIDPTRQFACPDTDHTYTLRTTPRTVGPYTIEITSLSRDDVFPERRGSAS